MLLDWAVPAGTRATFVGLESPGDGGACSCMPLQRGRGFSGGLRFFVLSLDLGVWRGEWMVRIDEGMCA